MFKPACVANLGYYAVVTQIEWYSSRKMGILKCSNPNRSHTRVWSSSFVRGKMKYAFTY